MKDGHISLAAIMPTQQWLDIRRHIAGKPTSIGKWVAKALNAQHTKETSESDLVTQAHHLKSRLELMARVASYRCQYDYAARLGAIEEKAAARFERRLNKMEWAK